MKKEEKPKSRSSREASSREVLSREGQLHEVEPREVMDIRQAAAYLGISSDTLYKYASEAFVPAFKLGNRWRFRRSRLEEWMDRQSGLTEAVPAQAPVPFSAPKKPVVAVKVAAPSTTKPSQKKPVRSASRSETHLRSTR